MTVKELLAAYKAGNRDFHEVELDGANLSRTVLVGASFYGASMRGANLERALLTHVQLKGADLTEARLARAFINASDLIGATFESADLSETDLTGACLSNANLSNANLSKAWINNATLADVEFRGANLTGVRLSHAHFDDLDLSAFCDAKGIEHRSHSSIDWRAVVKTLHHAGLKKFMTDCGMPEVFSTYMIDCANACSQPWLNRLMQSTFISYGGPDEKFARKLYDRLRAHKVIVFFFPETAKIGERIQTEVFRKIQEHDRVLLICSRESLNRSGVVNEIRETLDREATDGGATYLLPVTLDDYVLTDWRNSEPELAKMVGGRIIGDFRKTRRNSRAFEVAVERVLDALKVKSPR